ncbi:reverse transcriptase domain-containing protein [Tanacetum coccineum]
MADNRTMAQMLQAPIEGYEDAIVIPPINANNFELKQPLINLVQSNKFTGRQDPHNHLRFFNKVTSTFRHPEVPNTSVKLLLFPFSLDGEARDWTPSSMSSPWLFGTSPTRYFLQLFEFKQLRLEIGLKDALVEMPKFNKWLSSLLRNKEKLEEIAITTVNAECSAIIMNKVPEKLEDPGKFLIPCALQELKRTSALADSGASINLLPYSIYKKLELEALTPTRDTIQFAN